MLLTDEQRMITAKEFAALLKVSLRGLYDLHDAGRLPQSMRFGRRHRWNPDVVRAWLDDGCPAVGQEEVASV